MQIEIRTSGNNLFFTAPLGARISLRFIKLFTIQCSKGSRFFIFQIV